MTEPGAPLRGRLLYVQLGSPEPERLARFYAEIFGMTMRRGAGGWICQGPTHCLAFAAGQARTLLSAGYAVAGVRVLEGLAARAASNLVDAAALEAELFVAESIALRDPDGNRIAYGVAAATTSAAGAAAPPARLQHVVVGSTDVARVVAFYTDIVGLRKSDDVRDNEGGTRASFLRSDDEHHSFAVFKTPLNRLDHHCYELPDWNGIRDWGDRLAARGVTIQWGPGRHGPGNNLFIFFHDPDGNWVELSAELEVVSPDRPVGLWRHEERTLNSWGRAYLRS